MAEYKQEDTLINGATTAQLLSLATILPRSFHPVNAYMRKCFPDTPSVRAWWIKNFAEAIHDPASHVLVALNPNGDLDGDKSVVGIICFRIMSATEKGAGMWSKTPPSAQDGVELDMYRSVTDFMTEGREVSMLGQEHLCIELFGADQDFKGTGIGKRLLLRACTMADELGIDAFVQANSDAKNFYCSVGGFEVLHTGVMPGSTYEEAILVRKFKTLIVDQHIV